MFILLVIITATLQAMLLQSYGVHVMAVGVGDKIRDAELQSIASRPSYVFRTDDFFTIQTVLGKVAHRICKSETQIIVSKLNREIMYTNDTLQK